MARYYAYNRQRKITPWDTEWRGTVSERRKSVGSSCGRGYDPIYFASALGLEAFGLEASSIAIEGAKQLIGTTPELASKVHIEAADFFEYKVADKDKFGLIYDYTYLCTGNLSLHVLLIQHSQLLRCNTSFQARPLGTQMNSLIKPGGYLITLMFPYVPNSPYSTGPPFYSNFDSYAEVLGPGWEVVFDRIPEDAPPAGNRMVVWKRKFE
ncbi:S-adenosyl-L-methionine-dependent methyltransferase [Rhodocollybia butyracea]|uniref:S-adenosyl-L-methionine-dependent methyltransferase n=1 Tax=Rhodocollybia butyracea TaxID=206335 RepID=A0A9P5P6W1_9AGAR|nr:S-adenosyl-L-methionine-dependent methyltransferase [Rhodocollybia butyracea]